MLALLGLDIVNPCNMYGVNPEVSFLAEPPNVPAYVIAVLVFHASLVVLSIWHLMAHFGSSFAKDRIPHQTAKVSLTLICQSFPSRPEAIGGRFFLSWVLEYCPPTVVTSFIGEYDLNPDSPLGPA